MLCERTGWHYLFFFLNRKDYGDFSIILHVQQTDEHYELNNINNMQAMHRRMVSLCVPALTHLIPLEWHLSISPCPQPLDVDEHRLRPQRIWLCFPVWIPPCKGRVHCLRVCDILTVMLCFHLFLGAQRVAMTAGGNFGGSSSSSSGIHCDCRSSLSNWRRSPLGLSHHRICVLFGNTCRKVWGKYGCECKYRYDYLWQGLSRMSGTDMKNEKKIYWPDTTHQCHHRSPWKILYLPG